MIRPNTFDAPISGNLSYHEAMYELQQYALEGIRAKTIGPHDFDSISVVVNKIDRIYDRVQGHLSSLENCSTFQQRCEHYAIRLHASFVSGWLCRGAFRRTTVPESQHPVRTTLVVKGKEYLIRSLRAYLNLHPLCLQASRSWSYIHNGLSSALVLGLLGEARVNPEVRELQGALIDTLSSMDDSESQQIGTDGTATLSKLHSRALAALTSLYGDQIQGPLPSESISPPAQKYQLSTAVVNDQLPVSKPPVYSATAIQNISQDRVLPPQNTLGISCTWEMSPMELFDSIIWGR